VVRPLNHSDLSFRIFARDFHTAGSQVFDVSWIDSQAAVITLDCIRTAIKALDETSGRKLQLHLTSTQRACKLRDKDVLALWIIFFTLSVGESEFMAGIAYRGTNLRIFEHRGNYRLRFPPDDDSTEIKNDIHGSASL
jgi:hypothetical protein